MYTCTFKVSRVHLRFPSSLGSEKSMSINQFECCIEIKYGVRTNDNSDELRERRSIFQNEIITPNNNVSIDRRPVTKDRGMRRRSLFKIFVCTFVVLALVNVWLSSSFISSVTDDTRPSNSPSNGKKTKRKRKRPRRTDVAVDFKAAILDTNHSCPLDKFFNKDCIVRKTMGNTVCFYPNAVLKKTKTRSAAKTELDAFELLNDTRYFPKLYYGSIDCQTILMENVRQEGKKKNSFCSNYTYYEEFYKSAFKIFNENNIVPEDLDACCNTVVDGDSIRIIDFGLYLLEVEPKEARKKNKALLEAVLKEVKKLMKRYEDRCTNEV